MAATLPLVTTAAHAGDIWTTLGGRASHSLGGAGISIGRFDRVELSVSPQMLADRMLADRVLDRVPAEGAELAGGVAVRLSAAASPPLTATAAMHARSLADPPGVAIEGDAYDMFLAFFMHRPVAAASPAPDPAGVVVRADRPAAAAALLAGL